MSGPPRALALAVGLALAGCSSTAPSTLTLEPPSPTSPTSTVTTSTAPTSPAPTGTAAPAPTQPCSDVGPVAPSESVAATEVAFGEAYDLTMVDNEVLEDDIIELTVGAPVLTALPGATADQRTGWQVEVEARQISGAPGVSLFDLLLTDAQGGSCRLDAAEPETGRLAPGEAARQRVRLTFEVAGGSVDDYTFYLLDTRTREAVLRWR
ncbi:hypothetical protein [Ornithinimicrobium sediminis]|uniref:hypothetical protein n=1 Tax=Ornithinimicrobium sediminis TaxID=2904603 RepID=UPI001E3CF727|nr:hypothetical protein [Ornithinimicrobium sediminis]MCE0485234.1 hypothetical protein [Ornithinimicrobium sediminis]